MVKSKRAQQLLDARNNKAENQRNKKKDDELRAEESREIDLRPHHEVFTLNEVIKMFDHPQ